MGSDQVEDWSGRGTEDKAGQSRWDGETKQ